MSAADPEFTSIQLPIARIWSRLGALLIDGALFYIIASILGQTFYEGLMRLNPWLPWLAQALPLLYFALGESRLFEGQTLGKAILRIRVATTNGQSALLRAGFLRALIKYACFGVVLQPDKLALALPADWRPVAMLVFFLFTVLALALIIGELTSLFMHPRRRTLHDLTAGTQVIRERAEGELGIESEFNPLLASRERLALRFGLFAFFISFGLLSYYAIDLLWLSPAAKDERTVRRQVSRDLDFGEYYLQAVSLPSEEKAKRVHDFIALERERSSQAGREIPTTETLRQKYTFDDQLILASLERVRGSLAPEQLENPALRTTLEELRARLWREYTLRLESAPLRENLLLRESPNFQCLLWEDLSLLYYRTRKPGKIARAFGPADPKQGVLTFEIVKTPPADTDTAATATQTRANVQATPAAPTVKPLVTDHPTSRSAAP